MFSLAVRFHELDDCIPVLLISAGANPNIQSKAGFTALILAVCYNGSGVGILLNAHECTRSVWIYCSSSALNGNLVNCSCVEHQFSW